MVTYDVSKGDQFEYVGMTANGSKVFFMSTEQLTADDHDTSSDLYMWSEATDQLTQLSAGERERRYRLLQLRPGRPSATSWLRIYTGARCRTRHLASAKRRNLLLLAGAARRHKGVPDGRNIYLYREGRVHYVATAQRDRG